MAPSDFVETIKCKKVTERSSRYREAKIRGIRANYNDAFCVKKEVHSRHRDYEFILFGVENERIRLCLDNLDEHMKAEDVRQFLQEFFVLNVVVDHDQEGNSLRTGYVETTKRDAERILNAFNGKSECEKKVPFSITVKRISCGRVSFKRRQFLNVIEEKSPKIRRFKNCIGLERKKKNRKKSMKELDDELDEYMRSAPSKSL